MNRLNYDLDSLRFENKTLKDELKEFKEKYRVIYEENPSMYFTVNTDGLVLSVNSYGAKQLGYTIDELIGKSVLDVFHFEDKKKVLNQLNECLENPDELYKWDLRKVHRDGTVMWVREFARVVQGDGGRNVVLIACEDITRRKQAEEVLQKSYDDLEIRVEERTLELTKANEALKAEIAERRCIESALNENLSKLAKKNRYETIISTITSSVHQSIDLQEVLDNAVEAMSKYIEVVEHVAIYLVENSDAVMKVHRGHPDWFVKRVKRIPYPKGFTWKTIIEGKPIYCADVDIDDVIGPAGKEVGTKSYASMPLSCDGKTVGSINVHSFRKDAFDDEELELLDIVGKQIEVAIKNAKQAEALRESEKKYRSLVEQTNDWVFEIDENGVFTYVNPKVSEIIGYQPEELLGKTSFDFMSPDESIRVADIMGPIVSEHRAFKRLEKKLIHKAGPEVFLEISGSPIFDDRGAFKGYHGVVQNITNRKRTEKELRTLNNITEAMNQSLDLDEIYKIALDSVIEQEHVDLACIYLVDNSRNEAVMQAQRKFPDDFIRRAGRIPYPKGATWKVIKTKEVVNVKNASEDPDVGPAGRDLGFRSMLGIPVAIEGNTVGVLWLMSYVEHQFTKSEVEFLTAIGSQIATAIAKANLYENLMKRNKDLGILNSITQAVHKSLELDEIYRIALDMTAALENVDMACIYLVDIDANEAVLQDQRNFPADYLRRASRIPYPKGITWKVIKTAEVLNIENAQEDPNIGPAGRDLGHHGLLGIPITSEGKVIGVLWFLSYKERRFDKQEIDLFSSIGNQIGAAISKANVYGELSKKKRYEEITSAVTRSVHRSINLQDVMENAVESMSKNIEGVNNVCIYLVEGKKAVMKASRGYPQWFLDRVRRIPYPKGFTWNTIIEGKPRYVADTADDQIIGPAGLKVGTKSYAAMPIRFVGKAIGCININSFELNAFDEEELKLLENVAHQIENAINNARQAEALRQSEERYRVLFDQSPVGVYLFDNRLRIIQTNDQMAKILESSVDKIIGLDMNELRDQSFLRTMKKALDGESCLHEGFYEATTSQAKLWLSIQVSPLRDYQGKVVAGMAVVEDITERKKIEEALRESEGRLTYIFDNTPNVAIEGYDIDGKVLYWNKAAEKIFGWTKEQALGKTLDQLILDKESTKEFNSILKKVKETNQPNGPSEWRFINGEGEQGTVYSTVFPIPSSSGSVEFICMDIDITERKRQEEQIHHMAMHDSLTDLPNRRALQDTLDRLIKGVESTKTHALVVMDLDNFKLVNDTLGHLEGDQVLIKLADIIRKNMRPIDIVARVGGDEFAMVITNVSTEEAKAIADRFYMAINGHNFYIKGYNFKLGISIGISLIDRETDPQIIMAMAYSALSKAKYEGKNRIILHQPDDRRKVESDPASHWGIRINDALNEDRLMLYFQPVVQLDSGNAEYMEALIRMRDENDTTISPKTFIPAAERFGLMSKIDRWVVERAIIILKNDNGLRLFVNISGSSLRDESLLLYIENIIRANGLVSHKLGFEITEFTNISNTERVKDWMQNLKDIGCQFALDDFGMGYSSFGHLSSLPVDYVKIEESFIQGLHSNPSSRAIVEAIITVAHIMGKKIIAEGVETESVVEFLKKLEVKYAQGNLWRAPKEEFLFEN